MDDRDRTRHRPSWIPWAAASALLFIVAIVGFAIGTRQSVGEVRMWGFGPFFGILLFFWFFGAMRWMCWGCWPRYDSPWRHRRYYYRPYDDEREDWDDWHRRAHERMDGSRPTPPSGSA